MKCNIFELYEKKKDGTDKLIMTGTAKEIGEFTKLTASSVHQAAYRGGMLSHTYKVVLKETRRFGSWDKPYKAVIITRQKKSKFQQEYERIQKHLLIYGNTITSKSPERYIEKLQAEGFEVKYERSLPYYESSNSGKDIIKFKGDWLITLIKKPENMKGINIDYGEYRN